MKDSLTFYIDRGKGKRKHYIIKLDPDRYVKKRKDGKVFYYDKVSRLLIPEEVFNIMLDELIVQPIDKPDVTFDELYSIIFQVRERVAKTLQEGFRFDDAIMPSKGFLKKHINSKMKMVILYVDIVGSTKISQSLPSDKLAMLIKIFAQEMSCLISAYNGYVLKYAGDSVISFFPLLDDEAKVCSDAVNCARSMINIVRYAINPILKEHGYPEIRVKIGIDLGENQIVSIGKSLDIIGYTMSIAAKIVEFAKPWNVIIGKWVYDGLSKDMKRLFKRAMISKQLWNYRDSKEGKYYPLYMLDKRIKAKVSRKVFIDY